MDYVLKLQYLFTDMFISIFLQQAGVAIVLDVEAISKLLENGVSATDDSLKYIWFQVCLIYYPHN